MNAIRTMLGFNSTEEQMATYTENGAVSYPANDPMLDLFYKALRNTPEDKMRQMVRSAWQGSSGESPEVQRDRKLTVLKLLFHLRWCRGGKGERNMFTIGISELIALGEKEHVLANVKNIPYFGYWKDLLNFLDTEIEDQVVTTYTNQLIADRGALADGKPQNITLAAKWAPSEGKEIDRKHQAVAKFAKALRVNKAQYRKQYTAPLRKQIKIVETQLCEGEWDQVNYEHLPSLARLKYAKAFRKHDEDRFDEYMTSVAAGNAKMNIKLVHPYQLVKKYVDNHYSYGSNDSTDDDLDTMWNELVKQTRKDLKEAGADLQALAIADLSGSMDGIPMYNSVALSLLWAELCEGRFHGHCYVFSNTATLVKIEGDTLREKVRNLMDHATFANTNLQAVFKDLLSHATMWNVPDELYPKKMYIFTDGQFDSMVDSGSRTHLQAIAQKHEEAGYTVPEIVFWNLRGDTVDFPSPGDKPGVAMLSGFSPSLLSLIMQGKELTPVGIMRLAIADPEFDRIKLAE